MGAAFPAATTPTIGNWTPGPTRTLTVTRATSSLPAGGGLTVADAQPALRRKQPAQESLAPTLAAAGEAPKRQYAREDQRQQRQARRPLAGGAPPAVFAPVLRISSP